MMGSYPLPQASYPPSPQGSVPPPAASFPPPQYPPAGSTGSKPPRNRRGWLIAGVVFVLVAVVATTAVLVLRSGDSAGEQAVIGTTVPTGDGPVRSAAPPGSALPTVAPESKAVPRVAGSSGAEQFQSLNEVATQTAAGTTPAVAPSDAGTPAVDDPLGVPRADIPCGDGYIVQVASELDSAAFAGRIAELRSAGLLPPGAQWAETSSSCEIFSTQSNVLVLYAGPFSPPRDACPTRLASPADAFIKGTTPETSTDFVTCLCPARVDQLPTITAVGQQDVWVGELQRVLGAGMDYPVGAINADPATGNPGQWGTYTAQTAVAVGLFQSDQGLPVTEQVDAATWSALLDANC